MQGIVNPHSEEKRVSVRNRFRYVRAVAVLIGVAGLAACGASTQVKVTPVGEGKITSAAGIDCGTRCEATVRLQGGPPVARGTISLNAVPGAGSRLLGWNRDGCAQENTCVLPLEQYCAIGQSPLPGCSVWDTQRYDLFPVFVREDAVLATAWSPASSCAIYLNGDVRCWNAWGVDTQVPVLHHPVQVVTDLAISCAEDDNGVQCWGAHTRPLYQCPPGVLPPAEECTATFPERPPLPALFPPLTLAAGAGFVCALDGEGVKCWSGYGDTPVPALIEPRNIRAENRQVCVDDATGKVCWKKDYRLPAS